MKTATAKLMLSIFTMVLGLGAMAQKGEGKGKEKRAEIHEKRMSYCNEEAGLTEKEAANYWAIDKELHEAKKEIRKNAKGLKDIDLESSGDAEIAAAIKEGKEAKIKAEGLDLAYVDKFLGVISAKKLALMMKAERSFKREVLKDLKGGGPHGEKGGHRGDK